MQKPIQNKVAASSLITLDLLEFKPKSITEIDVADVLWEGLVLKEKEFRDWVKELDWSSYENQCVSVHCSTDAIVAPWAFVLISTALNPYTRYFTVSSSEPILDLWKQKLSAALPADAQNVKLVLKGCGDESVPISIYTEFVRLHQSKCSSIMYGEPCSTVPLYKAKR